MSLAGSEPTRQVDPAVTAAEAERDHARAVFDELDTAWRTASLAARQAPYDGSDPQRRQQLVEYEQAARERRDAAWAGVVRGNGAVDAAARAPMLRTH
jgi:hypothetical protein